MFMHGGFMHIAGNMLFLKVFGDNIEARLGNIKFLLFYLACGVVASFGHILTDTSSLIPSLGASGAISGVL
jgi:membrane associated rhomboid family serine protease